LPTANGPVGAALPAAALRHRHHVVVGAQVFEPPPQHVHARRTATVMVTGR